MANRKLNSIKFPDIADTYILDADKVNYDDSETYTSGSVGKALQNKADNDGSYSNMTVGNAEQLVSNVKVNDQTPYLFRTSGGSVDIGDREYVNGIVGGTVAWNQLVQNGNFASTTGWYQSSCSLSVSDNVATVTASEQWGRISSPDVVVVQGHKYFVTADVKGTTNNYVDAFGFGNKYVTQASAWQTLSLIILASQSGNYKKVSIGDKSSSDWSAYNVKNVMVIDLTQMFGSTIADYIYSLEQANAGAGVAWFKKLFPKPYYAYNAGELKSVSGLVSHDMTGFNQWDEEWEVGIYSTADGEPNINANRIRSKNAIPVVPNTTYYFEAPTTYGNINVHFYDVNGNWINYEGYKINTTFTTPANCAYVKWNNTTNTVTSYGNDICINISWDNSRNGEYEPYELHSYPLDTDLTLRGIPKLDANNSLYYDGDIYEADGTVTRKYGVVDLSTLSWTQGSGSYWYSPTGTIPNGSSANTIQPIISDKYVADTQNNVSASVNNKTIAQVTTGRVAICDSSVTTSSDITGHLVYELATPTTETADAYVGTQIVNDFGTEEYVISDNTFAVPVGHDTDYPINLVAKLEMAPNSPDGDGMYVVKQTNGTNEYVPLIIPSGIPAVPSENGSYTLTATVADGTTTLSWS